MRLAVIDCGTNTFNLIIVDVGISRKFTRVYNTRVSVKLGEGAINKGYIAQEPFNRALRATEEFGNLIKLYKVEKVLAFATSAIRDAVNGKEFTDTVKNKCGIEIKTIDGNKEADLIYLGVKGAVNLGEKPSLIMDIGGGSTEFILADKNQIYWKHSFQIGAARLLDKFKPSNPIDKTEIEEINSYFRDELQLLIAAITKYEVNELVGSSGAFDSVVEMIEHELGGEHFTLEKTEYQVSTRDYFRISEKVIASTTEERKLIKGLVPMRFDMIVISCLMIDFVLKSFGLQKMRVSTYSLKEGAITDFINSTL